MKKQKKANLIIFLALVLAAAVLFFNVKPADKEILPAKAQVTIGGRTLSADIADTPKKQAAGLSGRKELKDDEGMIFVFKSAGMPGFWMKDMLFPIDIIWVGEDKRILSVSENLKPASYPENFYPPGPVMYVLEVPAGFSLKNNLKTGDTVIF